MQGETMEKDKRKHPQSSGCGRYGLLFLFLYISFAAMCCIVFTFPAGCTWHSYVRPYLIDPPPNSTLVSDLETSQDLYKRLIIRHYDVNDASPRDVIAYYENEVGSECQVDTTYTRCFGSNPNIGNYIILIAYDTPRRLTVNYSVTWYWCRIGWRFQDS